MSQAPFVINPALVAIAVDFAGINARQRGYISDVVVPRVRVDTPEFRYPTFPIDDAFTVHDTSVGRLGRLNEITSRAEQEAGFVKDWGLAEPIPYRDELAARNQAIPFNLRARAARNVVDKVQLAREIRCANLLFSAGNYQTGYKQTLAGTNQFGDPASKPTQIVGDTIETMLLKPNVAVMGERVYNRLRRNADISVYLGGSALSGRAVDDADLARALQVQRIVVGNTIRQSSKRGQTLVTGPIWGDHMALLYMPTLNADGTVLDVDSPAFALTFQWNGIVAGETPDPDMGLYGGVRVKTGESVNELRVAPFAGYLFTNAVAPAA